MDHRQRARPFAIRPLAGEWERANRGASRSGLALSHFPAKMNGSNGRPLVRSQDKAPIPAWRAASRIATVRDRIPPTGGMGRSA